MYNADFNQPSLVIWGMQIMPSPTYTGMFLDRVAQHTYIVKYQLYSEVSISREGNAVQAGTPFLSGH